MSKEIKVSDLFKEYGDRSKPTPDADKWYNNRSVYSKNFIKSVYKNTVNDFSRLVSDENIKEIRLVNLSKGISTKLDTTYSNRVQFFYFDSKKIDYSEITKIESLENTNGYSDYKNIGFSEFYTLYKKNDFGIEQELCTMAIYRG